MSETIRIIANIEQYKSRRKLCIVCGGAAPTGGFEPLACRLGGGRSILLSYVGLFNYVILTHKTYAVNSLI